MRLVPNIPMPAGQQNPLGISATYIRLASSSIPITVKDFDTGEENLLVPGKGIRFDKLVKLVLINETATDVVIDIEVGEGEGQIYSADISGEVKIIGNPNAYEKSMNGFMYGITVAGVPAAGKYHGSQIYNPAGSGVNVIVTRAVYEPEATTGVWVGVDGASYLTFIDYAYNRYAGASLSNAAVRVKDTFGGGGDVIWLNTALAGSRYHILENDAKIVLPPGKGFNISNNTIDVGFTINYDWYEESI